MELITPRLRLDVLRESDAETLFQYRSDPSVALYQGWCPGSRDEALDFIRSQQQIALDVPDSWLQLAIRRSDDETLIGDLGLHLPPDAEGSYEFGVTIAPAHQSKGYAREAVQALLDFVFRKLSAHRVHASIDPRNVASGALLRSLGMRQEAHFRESLKMRGEWVDDVIFALLAREWPTAGARG